MTEPERWLDGNAPHETLDLLRAGLEESPSARCLQRTLAAASEAAVGLSVAATVGAGSLGAGAKAASTSLTLSFGKVLTLSLFVGASVLGSVAVVRFHGASSPVAGSAITRSSPPIRRGAQSGAAYPVTATTATTIVTATPTATLGMGEGRIGSETPHQRSLKSAAVRGETAPVLADSAFADEVRYLDQMRARLQTGDANGTLASAAAYERIHRPGHFVPEVLYLRMEAYRNLGKQGQAIATASEIVRRFPSSAQARRAQTLLETGSSENERQ